ncbi:Domain of uncharacterised function (DUF2825) [Klebsiella pneumoniae]|nr:Domain of uncharacterised function (DUF2825) [Klebsiella pneumoniae]
MRELIGLSPLARGTPLSSSFRHKAMRFIPAGAGNTLVFVLITRFSTVYPRWRGEHFKLPTGQEIHIGLSPLARGTRALRCIICQTIRFIPAGAGNTRYYSPAPVVGIGLSPLARGTLNISSSNRTSIRFIPAGAGNTSLKTTGVKWTTVYPRWRGEHLQPKLNFGFVIGLSPLARGTLLDIPEHCADLRFIPAGAGNTNQAEYSINPTTVYPRWRGEHSSTPARRVRVSGLSPLARGTRPASG